MTLYFTVVGQPIPLARSRVGRYGQVYTPRRSLKYQQEIWYAAREAGASIGMFSNRPVWLGVQVYLPRPKPGSAAAAVTLPYPAFAPDLDNFIKQVMDALRPAYDDDGQVVGFLPGTGKYWGEPGLVIILTDRKEIGNA